MTRKALEHFTAFRTQILQYKLKTTLEGQSTSKTLQKTTEFHLGGPKYAKNTDYCPLISLTFEASTGHNRWPDSKM